MTYPTDLSDAESQRLQPRLSPANRIGKPREVDLRAVPDAIFYQADNSIQWRALLADFPAGQPLYGYYRLWLRLGLRLEGWQQTHDHIQHTIFRNYFNRSTR